MISLAVDVRQHAMKLVAEATSLAAEGRWLEAARRAQAVLPLLEHKLTVDGPDRLAVDLDPNKMLLSGVEALVKGFVEQASVDMVLKAEDHAREAEARRQWSRTMPALARFWATSDEYTREKHRAAVRKQQEEERSRRGR